MMELRSLKSVYLTLVLAAVFWFLLFSPWTAPVVPFWPGLTCAGLVLGVLALALGRPWPRGSYAWGKEVCLGILTAVVLWGVFWLGDKVSQLILPHARAGVDAVYAFKGNYSPGLLAVLLLGIIGPAEEIFWRGYVQRLLGMRYGVIRGFIIATLAYTLVHIWSGNFMLLMAAGVCGIVWGGLYALMPRHLPAWIISHALWDAAAFVFFPF